MPLLGLLCTSLATARLQFPANSTEITAEARQKQQQQLKKPLDVPGFPGSL